MVMACVWLHQFGNKPITTVLVLCMKLFEHDDSAKRSSSMRILQRDLHWREVIKTGRSIELKNHVPSYKNTGTTCKLGITAETTGKKSHIACNWLTFTLQSPVIFVSCITTKYYIWWHSFWFSVCVCVYIYVCVCVCAFVCMHLHVQLFMHIDFKIVMTTGIFYMSNIILGAPFY